jgi:hypothetical protein
MEKTELTEELMAIIEVSPEFLRERLFLPKGSEIVDARFDMGRRGVIELKIIGAGWPTKIGDPISHTSGVVVTEHIIGGEDVVRNIEFGLSSKETI